jgi:hypothetical protein
MVPLSRGHELPAKVSGLALELSEFEFRRTSVHPGLAFGEQPIEEASQNACSGLHGFNASPFGPEVSKTSAQVTLTPEQRWRGHAEDIPPALAAVFAGMADDSASTDVPRRSAIEPRAPMPFSLPGTQIRAHFGQHRLDRHDIDTIYRGRIPSPGCAAVRIEVEGGALPLRLTSLRGTSSLPVGRRLVGASARDSRRGRAARYGCRRRSPSAIREVIGLDGLLQLEPGFFLPVPAQAVPHLFGGGLNAPMAPGRQPPGGPVRFPQLSSRIVLGNCTFISVSALCPQRPA